MLTTCQSTPIVYDSKEFPRLTSVHQHELADCVLIATFYTRLSEIVVSVLRDYLKSNINRFPDRCLCDIARDIRRMRPKCRFCIAREINRRSYSVNKADAEFRGWDLPALADFVS
jgi:hypothetical protein